MKPDIVLLVNYYCFFKVVEVQQDIFIIKKVQQHIKKEKKKKKQKEEESSQLFVEPICCVNFPFQNLLYTAKPSPKLLLK